MLSDQDGFRSKPNNYMNDCKRASKTKSTIQFIAIKIFINLSILNSRIKQMLVNL